MVRRIQIKIIKSEYNRKCYSCGEPISEGVFCIQEKHIYEVNPISYYYHPYCFAEMINNDPSKMDLIDASFIKKLMEIVKRSL